MIGGMETQLVRAPLRKGTSRDRAPLMIRTGLAIGSFVIYAIATLMLNQPREVQYDTERSSLAAAVSNVVYGAPIGMIYTGVLAPLWDPDRPMQQTFEDTARHEGQAGSLLKAATDGNGIGYLVIASLAMRLFGLHLCSLNFALITLMAVSTVVFLLRYRDGRLLFVPLCFLSLTIMLFTPLVTDPQFASQIPIGGIRYFSLVGILPATHILLEILEPSKIGSKTAIHNLILLGVQLLVLATTVVVRGSAGYLLGALMIAYVLALRARRGAPAASRNLFRKGILMAVVSTTFVGSFYLWVPDAYKESGRTLGIFWHRVLISLGANPAWPFGNLRDAYSSCARYSPPFYTTPQSLVADISDWNGQCIWVVYALEHGLTPGEAIGEIYGGRYETVMKNVFLEIAHEYPRQVLKTFLYYKPRLVLTSIGELLAFHVPGETSGAKSLLLALLFVQAAALIAFICSRRLGSSENRMKLLTGPLVLSSVCSLTPLLVGWSNPYTTADPLCYFFVGLGLVLAGTIEAMHKFTRQLHPGVRM